MNPVKTRSEAITELAAFLAGRTRLATIDPSAARSIAAEVYDGGWRRPEDDLNRGVQIGHGNVQTNVF